MISTNKNRFSSCIYHKKHITFVSMFGQNNSNFWTQPILAVAIAPVHHIRCDRRPRRLGA